MMFKNREEFLQTVITNSLRLNKYDYRFLNNLLLLLAKNNYITTNQNQLFEKLVMKYKKQLKGLGVSAEAIINLDWTVEQIDSDKEHTEAFVSIENNELKLRLPFNKKFIDTWHNHIEKTYTTRPHGILVWSKAQKMYVGKATAYNLLLVNKIVPMFYNTNYCVKSQSLIDLRNSLIDTITDPTYKKINNSYYIIGANKHIIEATKDIDFNDDPNTLLKLSLYGITIDESVTGNNKFKKFAGQVNSSFDVSETSTLITYFKALNISNIICNMRFTSLNKMFLEKLTEHFTIDSYQVSTANITKPTKHSVLLKANIKGSDYLPFVVSEEILKCITITNSTPVKL